MGGLLKRYRELIVVVVLLFAPLGLYLAHAKHPSERSRFDRALLWVSTPIEKATEWGVVKALDIWNGYIALRHAHERANMLQRERAELELDRWELQRVLLENERLRTLLSFADTSTGRRVVGARVIGVRFDPKGLQLVTIDRGASSGISEMMPVVVGSGVVGRVHSVSASTSDVLLLSDRNSSIAVVVERTRARANVRGTGSPDDCRLEYALRSDDMTEGDVLVTSGTDGVFPRGLPVGTVVNLKRSGQGLYQKAAVKPVVDVTKLEELLVMTVFDRRPEPPPVAVATDASARPGEAKPKGTKSGDAAKAGPGTPKPPEAAKAKPSPDGVRTKPATAAVVKQASGVKPASDVARPKPATDGARPKPENAPATSSSPDARPKLARPAPAPTSPAPVTQPAKAVAAP